MSKSTCTQQRECAQTNREHQVDGYRKKVGQRSTKLDGIALVQFRSCQSQNANAEQNNQH